METVALIGSLDQALACVDEAREARAAAFNDELSRELKTLGLPELTHESLLSISPAGVEEDDDKCAFVSAVAIPHGLGHTGEERLRPGRDNTGDEGARAPLVRDARIHA